MGTALTHRGPDDEQFFDDGVLSLVFRRLAVVDSAHGRQPFFSPDGQRLLVCNGEVYNHGELRRCLEGRHRFASRSDCEVLLHGHAQWGVGVLERARGMFALALWDRAERRLLLARDRLGIKPLYVCPLPEGLLFGSELKALLAHPDCPRDMDWSDLGGNPIAHALTPSYVAGITHLPGGHYLQAQPGATTLPRSYWDLEPHFNRAPYGQDMRRYERAYGELLESAVQEHLQGESATALHLSGGADSSLLAAIAARQQPGMPAYTIVERSNFLAGDSTAAAGVARSLGLDWNPVLVDYRNYVQHSGFGLATLEQSVWTMDSPLFDLEWLLKRELNRAIRQDWPTLKVLLLGQGADEFCGGYSKRIDAPFANWKAYLADEVQYSLGVGAAAQPLTGAHHAVFLGDKRRHGALSPYQRMMQLMPRQLQHHNLWHEDRSSAAFGLEARVPFLDHRLVEFLAAVPHALHARLFWNKRILRSALRCRLPDYDVRRPKVGFCFTDDTRSLEILVQNMALAAAPAFREQYMVERDYPFDRAHTEALIRQLQNREPGFHAAAPLLLGRMSATIFRRQVRQAAAAAVCHAHSASAVCTLPRLPAEGVLAVPAHFSDQPVMPFAWQAGHCPRVPAGCRIAWQGRSAGRDSYQLLQGETLHASLEFDTGAPWRQALLAGMGDPRCAQHTVADWAKVLGVPMPALRELLDTLLQCGFIGMPQLLPRRAALARTVGFLRQWLWRRTTPAPASQPPAPVGASALGSLLATLQARRRELEQRLDS